MRRIAPLIAFATVLFAGLLVIETLRSPDQFDMISLAADVVEMLILVGAVAMTAYVAVEAREMRHERRSLLADLANSRTESARWRSAARAHVEGLSAAIAEQFRDWRLTEAEADVAALMLKGLAHKEIATLRAGSEATVRQHAASVYRKSNLAGRTQLTAFFLEDLLVPTDPSARATTLVVVADRAGTGKEAGG